MWKRLFNTLAVAYLYYPHMILMRLLGPSITSVLTRGIAYVHWLLTFVGLERHTRIVLAQLLPSICPEMSVSEALRRHILMKHQNFSMWISYQTARGRRYLKQSSYQLEGQHHLDASIQAGRGVVLLVYHFGLAKMIVPALKSRGYDISIHRHMAATYDGKTFAWMAHAAKRIAHQNEEQSGIPMIFHNPDCSFPVLYRHLGRGGILSVNGDGMAGNDFIDISFLGSTMSFPAGPAQLSAFSKAPIIPVTFIHSQETSRLIVHEPIVVADASPESVEAATRQCVGLLERYVRQYPWAWWTWRRLRITQKSNGVSSLTADFVDGEVTRNGKSNQPKAPISSEL